MSKYLSACVFDTYNWVNIRLFCLLHVNISRRYLLDTSCKNDNSTSISLLYIVFFLGFVHSYLECQNTYRYLLLKTEF